MLIGFDYCCTFIALGARHIVAGDTLLIRDVTASDAGAYSCLARHALTATTKRARPALLTVTRKSAHTHILIYIFLFIHIIRTNVVASHSQR